MTGRAAKIVAKTDLRHLATQLLGEPRGTGPSEKWPSPDLTLSQTGATPPMSIFVGRDGKQRFTCFSSGLRGDAVDLVSHVKGLTTAESLRFLDEWTGAPSVAQRPAWTAPAPTPVKVATAAELEEVLSGARRELQKRPCDEARVWLTAHGLDRHKALEAGLGAIEHAEIPTCRYPVRKGIVLPNYSIAGELTGLQVRLLASETTKYLNVAGPNQTGVSFHRPMERRFQKSIAVTEGVVDAVVMAGHGIPAAAVLSTSRAEASIGEIARAAKGRRVVLAFDGDKAGAGAQRTVATRLQTYGLVSEIALPTGHDVSTMQARCPQWLTEQLRMLSVPMLNHVTLGL